MRRTMLAVALAAMLAMTAGTADAAVAHGKATGGRRCTGGYSPCLTYHGGRDYDCYGGGGNGPFYTKAGVVYQVHGSDPYGLDTDHDHKGCEKN
jgi:uncharacterized membrane protein